MGPHRVIWWLLQRKRGSDFFPAAETSLVTSQQKWSLLLGWNGLVWERIEKQNLNLKKWWNSGDGMLRFWFLTDGHFPTKRGLSLAGTDWCTAGCSAEVYTPDFCHLGTQTGEIPACCQHIPAWAQGAASTLPNALRDQTHGNWECELWERAWPPKNVNQWVLCLTSTVSIGLTTCASQRQAVRPPEHKPLSSTAYFALGWGEMGMDRNTERRELESRSEQMTFLKPFARGAWFGACWGSACLEGCPGAKQHWWRWLLTKPVRWQERRWFGETDLGTSLQGGGSGDVIYMNSTGACGEPGLTLLMKAAPGETWASPRVLNVLSACRQCPAFHTPHCTCPCLGLFPVLGVAESLPPAAQVYLVDHCRDLKKQGSSAPSDCHHDLEPWVILER